MKQPKQKILELIQLISDEDSEEVIKYLQQYIDKKKKETFEPEKYFGILKDWDINVEEECKKMRDEWENRDWNAISN